MGTSIAVLDQVLPPQLITSPQRDHIEVVSPDNTMTIVSGLKEDYDKPLEVSCTESQVINSFEEYVYPDPYLNQEPILVTDDCTFYLSHA